MSARWASRGLYWAVAALFVYAGAVKVADPRAFLSSILTYELFPYRAALLTASFAPFLEIVSGAALALGVGRAGARWLVGGMLAAFVALVAQAWLRGLSIDCGCFGSREISSGFDYAWKVGQNLLALGALVVAARLERGSD